jgi:2-methylcitrate dehydratase PrpD
MTPCTRAGLPACLETGRMTSITGQLADFCAGLRTRSLPEPVLDHAAAVLLDWLGAALAGASSESSALTRRLEPLLGGPREASLVGCAQRASMCLAALHNGTSSSVHELDDVHLDAAIHPSVVVIPAALAVAEATRCGARELLGGIVALTKGAIGPRKGLSTLVPTIA